METIPNRQVAAEMLADRLEHYKGQKGVVLAIPRGGVPVAAPIAKRLDMPLDVIVSKKIGHPANPEFAIGAVSLVDVEVDNRSDVPEEYIQAEVERIKTSLRQKYKLFMGDRQPVDLRDRIVIIVDDGIATGKTLLSTVNMARHKQPRKIIVAVPVAPQAAIAQFEAIVDEVVCLLVPPFFQAVGQFYEEFGQVSDEEVIRLLRQQGNSQ
ncbi:phosphoribosyltransferase [Pontibacter lucknowensis]|uniref:Predicted phosphoribosyltransferase n=1 Tax=Pontibacter lucknowensis TaxID=1077936 RepID=A0A1N7A8P3_9BACT|nr:phosphoribosyltransferase family protein [Pontibacter lucknowensis]SIR35418.1 Predicted phosphoribosyltransferase [Pontibacter lucknowensis]